MTYFCMFAFRKPFTVATYEGVSQPGTQIDLKTALVLSQIIGYTLSKFIGIKVNSEMGRSYRAFAIVAALTAAEATLILFALTPANWKIVPIFFNGLCLGMIWGLVVAYLEGRGTSEILLAGLSCSYIVATGVVKDCGRWVLSWGVGESWMPALTGVPFLLLLFLVVYGLDKIPEPTPDDVRMRCRRAPMLSADRWRFFTRYSAGMITLVLFYCFLTAYRDFRDLYGQEIFTDLGYGETPGIFSMTELPVAFGVMLALALLNTVRNSRAGTAAVFGLLLVFSGSSFIPPPPRKVYVSFNFLALFNSSFISFFAVALAKYMSAGFHLLISLISTILSLNPFFDTFEPFAIENSSAIFDITSSSPL